MTEKITQRKWVLLTLLVTLTLEISTQDNSILQSLSLPSQELLELEQNGRLIQVDDSNNQLSLNPQITINQDIITARQELRQNLNLQALMIQPIPEPLLTLEPDELDLLLYNIFHRFQTMEGIQYWSESRGTMRIFYEVSHLVDPAQPTIRLPDPLYQDILPENKLIIRQKDSSFGDNLYEVKIRHIPRTHTGFPGLHLSLVNRTTMKYGFIPIASPGQVMIDVTITRDSDDFAFYGSAGLRVPNIFGMKDRAANSFTNRLLALNEWFTQEINKN